MNLLVRGLIVVLILHGSSANMLSNALDSVSTSISSIVNATFEEVSTGITTFVNATTKLKASDYLNSLKITADGLLNVTGLVEELDLTDKVNITGILSSINMTVADGQLDLKSLFQNFNLTNVNFSDILSLANITISNGVLDFTSLSKKIENYANLTEFLSTISVQNLEDEVLDFIGLAKTYIGDAEEHYVTTEDGYILNLFHIPSKNNSGKVVLLSHGVLSSSDDFILRGNTSLVYMLVQEGYDVWVMNYRGNRYSRNHISLNPDTDASFWYYSMQEMGYYDLAAVIDFALNKTQQEQLSIIGHSEGTSVVFVLTSTKPEYNAKIKVFVALSPVVYLSDSGLVVTTAIRLGQVLNELFLAFGIEELLGYNSLERKLLKLICSQGTVGYELCVKVGLAAIVGYDPDNLEPDFFTKVLDHFPCGTSRMNLVHYVQVGNSDRFAHYNYGSHNEDLYGTEIAPIYDLGKVTCNVTLFAAKNDLILGVKAAARLKEELPNVRDHIVLEYDFFNHLDFLYAASAHILLYPQVIGQLP